MPTPPSLLAFAVASFAAVLITVIAGLRVRGRAYAIFAGIFLSLHALVSAALWPLLRGKSIFAVDLWPLLVYLQIVSFLHFFLLLWPRMQSQAYRILVSWPAAFASAAIFLATPWAILAVVLDEPPLYWLPFAAALMGLYESQSTRKRVVDLRLSPRDGRVTDGPAPRSSDDDLRHDARIEIVAAVPRLRRVRTGGGGDARPLRIVQLTDPHLGPFMTVGRLRRICAWAVAQKPDLVVLTGDYLTMQSQGDAGLLARALEPLAALPGQVFACRGNHDLEAPETIAKAFAAAGARLLIDEEAIVDTDGGAVQILGADYSFRSRRDRLVSLVRRFPRRTGRLRLILLHDPGAFHHLPEGEADLVLSGHTHGGQLGLVSFGLPLTVVRLFSSIPDQGFFARGRDRLYVHRGTGHYGFPLRIGVPAEQSMLRVHSA